MASTHEAGLHDQAAGLRRLMASPLSALCTVLSADGRERKPVLVNRLASSMARRGHPVMVLDTAVNAGTAFDARPSLLDVAQGRAALQDARVADAEGIAHCRLGAVAVPDELPALAALLQQLLAEGVRLLVNTELDRSGQLPLSMLADGDIVVQLSGSEPAIRSAYDMLRALKALCGRGTVSLLVTDVDPVRARHVHANLFHAASRYLALPVRSITAPSARRAGGVRMASAAGAATATAATATTAATAATTAMAASTAPTATTATTATTSGNRHV